MIRRIGHRFAAFFRATTPDPFVLAIGLTLLTAALAAARDGLGPIELAKAWLGTRDRGFWSLLGFSMQMVLILVTGHALASAPLVARAVRWVASRPTTGAGAVALVASLSVGTSLLNWGLGLVVGALLAREVGRSAHARGVRAHYPLLAAAGYTGMMTWHGGLSGSAPLKVTTQADLVELLGKDLGSTVAPIPFTQTVFGGPNLLITGGLVILVPLLCAAMAPRAGDEVEEIDRFAPGEPFSPDESPPTTWPERVESSPWLTALVTLMLGAAAFVWLRDVGLAKLDPNALNLAFLGLGLALHGRVRNYLQAVGDAVKGSSGIVLQFPFYAGIMALLQNTSLAAWLAESAVRFAAVDTYASVTFLFAGLLNVFVPSGGGQWAVQGPIAMRAAAELGAPLDLTVMAVAYGDQWTNMLQPFWALPLLGITGVKARDIIGYTTVVMLAAGVWIAGALYFVSP